ncbi:MAG: WYL domain-containing transcriptional regulator [Acutalibacteraceae bacterium]|nr:WYL domain-containing transcriptional regulator [Acutalibacteraceae bacterium]
MGKELNKIKLLFLHDIFSRQTDKDHVYSANELCDLLMDYSINCERKSIYSDIEALKEYGMDIVNVRSPKRGYYLKDRKFDIAEVRLLIDAVQAAKFISSRKTKALIYKIGSLLSEFQEEELREQIYVDSTFKSEKEDLYDIIKILDTAIKKSKQVQVTYSKRKLENRYLKTMEGKVFLINPYSLLWSNDHYYLVCNNDKYNNLMHLRLDRISEIVPLDTASKHFSKVSKYTEKFDTADYSNKIFNMFTGESGEIELCCNNNIIDDILEKFGDEIPLKVFDESHFTFKADVEMSNGLISWIMQYGADVKVLSPKQLSDALLVKTREILSIYE